MSNASSPLIDYLVVVIAGLMLFGLFCAALSTIDSYLLSSVQTFTWDILYPARIEALRAGKLGNDQNLATTREARRALYYLSLPSLIIFEILVLLLPDKVFVTQFLIAAALISIAPAMICGLILFDRNLSKKQRALSGTTAFYSIAIGFLATLVVFLGSVVAGVQFNAFAWGPIASLSLATLVATPLIWLCYRVRHV